MYSIRTITLVQPGRRDEAVGVAKEMLAELQKDIGFRNPRVLTGSIGPSDSTLVLEAEYETLAEFEDKLAKMNAWSGMQTYGPKLFELFVPGTNRFEVYRIQG